MLAVSVQFIMSVDSLRFAGRSVPAKEVDYSHVTILTSAGVWVVLVNVP